MSASDRDGGRLERATRLFARLLRLYPAAFRERFGADALALFRDRYREARRAGRPFGMTRFWARTLRTVAIHGPAERLAALRARPSRGAGRAFSDALRSIRRAPVLPAVVTLTLALGIGSTVALFSVVRGVLLRPLPFHEPDRLVRIWETNPGVDDDLRGVSPWNFADMDGRIDGVSAMTSWYLTSGTVRTETVAEEIRGAQVTADFFEVFDVRPVLGRSFRREEIVRYGPIMVSEDLWERLYGGDPSIVGRTVTVSGSEYEVVGIVPTSYTFPDPDVEFWLSWDMATVYADRPEARTWRFLRAAARLEAGWSIDDASREFAADAAGRADAHPTENRGWTTSLAPLRDDLVADVRGTLWVAFAAVSSLLLIACANVANLLLARVPERGREMAIRSSLGASRGDQVAVLLAEGVMFSVVGGALGLGFAAALLRVFGALGASRIPRVGEVDIDAGVVAFTLLISVGTSLVFGLAPAFHALRASASASLRVGTRTVGSVGAQRARRGFVAAQVAVAVTLLTGAALFRTSLERILEVDPGFVPEGAVSFRVSVDPGPAGSDGTARYYRALLDDVGALPGVRAVGAAQTLPMDPVAGDFERPFRPRGSTLESAEAPPADMRIATRGFMDAMGIALVEGRDFTGDETRDEPPVAIVNRALARRVWPNGGAVGRVFELDWPQEWREYTVVGVVDDVRHDDPRTPSREEIYVPHGYVPYAAMSVVVRSAGDPAALVPALRTTVEAQDRLQPAYNFTTLEGLRRAALAPERFLAWLLQVFSGIALVLVSVGVYGVVAYSVAYRRREIGVRMALGAPPRAVAVDLLGRAMAMTGLGAGIGLVVVRLAAGSVDTLLFGVASTDPRGGAIGLAVVVIVAAVASYLPARRAAGIPPAAALAGD